MLTEEIEKAAASKKTMPDNIKGEEQLLFLQLKYLYALFHTGKLTAEQGKAEKVKILESYKARCAKRDEVKLLRLASKHLRQTVNYNGTEYTLTAVTARGNMYQAEITDKNDKSVCIVRLTDIFDVEVETEVHP